MRWFSSVNIFFIAKFLTEIADDVSIIFRFHKKIILNVMNQSEKLSRLLFVFVCSSDEKRYTNEMLCIVYFESSIIFFLLFNTNIFIFLFFSFFKVKERIFGCYFSFDISFWHFKFIINSNRIPEFMWKEERSVVVTKRKQHLFCRGRKEKDFSEGICLYAN